MLMDNGACKLNVVLSFDFSDTIHFFGGKCPYACMYIYDPTFLFIFKAFQDGSAVVFLHAVC